jgi:hypothetical protein
MKRRGYVVTCILFTEVNLLVWFHWRKFARRQKEEGRQQIATAKGESQLRNTNSKHTLAFCKVEIQDWFRCHIDFEMRRDIRGSLNKVVNIPRDPRSICVGFKNAYPYLKISCLTTFELKDMTFDS